MSAAATPADYIASLPEDRRPTIQTLHDAIRAAAPGLAPAMVSGMIGYGQYHYKYASGREGDWFLAGLCARKSHYSLYICAAEEGAYLVESHAKELGRVKVGRSCINFKRLEDLNLPVALKLVKRAEALGGVGAVP